MIKGLAGTVLWSLLAGCVGIGLFFVKHEVKDLETRLAGLNLDIVRNQEEMHVLKAEWSYLNDPARLRDLSERHLGMRPMGTRQIATLDTLPGAPSDLPALAAAPKLDTPMASNAGIPAVAKADVSAGLKPEPRPSQQPAPKTTPTLRPQLAVASKHGTAIAADLPTDHGEER